MRNRITRRTFEQIAAAAIGSVFTPGSAFAAQQQATGAAGRAGSGVVPTSRCFLVNGKPVFLASAQIDYARVPHQLWRDRILRAKRAGLNCISSYFPWNFHESREGAFDFKGDCDVERFIDTCHELGMYYFARVGPFVSGEWEAGGYPAWLLAKPGTEVRTNNDAMRPLIYRWFEQLIPRIAARQVTRGGPVVLVQAENEYPYVNRSGGPEYLQDLIRVLREFGIEVPVTDCDGLDLTVPGSLKTLNGFNLGGINRYRKQFPGLPVFQSEFYPGWLECWNCPIFSENPPLLATYQQATWTLALQAMFNYYMFHGGTNFGFWAASTWKSDDSFVTTRYYSDAPVAEGGALNERYFAAKSGGILAANFNDFLCQAEPVAAPLEIHGPIETLALGSPGGVMQFVIPQYPSSSSQSYRNDGRRPFLSLTEERPTAEIATQPGFVRLPIGKTVPLAEGSAYPMMLPFEMKLDDNCRIDFANCTLIGSAGPPGNLTLLFRGEAGRTGVVSVNGQQSEFLFGSGEAVSMRAGGTTVLALPRDEADRVWFADGRVLMGPAFVGEQRDAGHECWIDERVSTIRIISAAGEHHSLKVEPAPRITGQVPLLGWKAGLFPEISGEAKWRRTEGPGPAEKMGGYYGYTWYKAAVESEGPRKTSLFLTHAADRIHIFQDCKRVGTWGTGPKAVREPLPVELVQGRNNFVFLCDNMGRSGEGKKAHDFKGILGDVYTGASEQPLGDGEYATISGPPRAESWEFQTYRHFPPTSASSYFRLRWRLPNSKADGALLALRWLPQYAWIYVNGKFVGEHPGDQSLIGGFCSSDFVLDQYVENRPLEIEIAFYGEAIRDMNEHVRLFTYSRSSVLKDWHFKTWENPTEFGAAVDGLPIWWECELPRPELPGPLFLVTNGLSKGHVYLNGRAAGRYWEVGPQHSLYLPEPWFEDKNRLVVFDEEGRRPEKTYLVRDTRFPTRKVLA